MTVGGGQQMVEIGSALMARSRVLLLDDPSMGLARQPVALLSTARRVSD